MKRKLLTMLAFAMAGSLAIAQNETVNTEKSQKVDDNSSTTMDNELKEIAPKSMVDLEVNGVIKINHNQHKRGKIRLWKETNTSDGLVSHGIGTGPYVNTYGPGASYSNTIGHSFYTYKNELALQIGVGGFGKNANRLNSYFYGKVGIGTYNVGDYMLSVYGKIRGREVVVRTDWWPDYVFAKDYSLRSLSEVQEFIDKNHHLPEVPSAEEIEKDGVALGEISSTLLKKIEELTLYTLQQQKEIDELRRQLKVK